jgi:signal transduction histidine kinase
MRDYADYRFTSQESCAINIFFDLAQEFDDLEQVYLLSVLILRMFFQYQAELYLKDETSKLVMVTPPMSGSHTERRPEIRSETWNDGAYCYVPVYGKNAFALIRNEQFSLDEAAPLGVLALHISRALESHELLFLEKYANRVGFCLDTKILALRNERHVLFLRKLAHDIGHNIITPNMRLKLMLNHLEGQITSLGELIQNAPDTAVHSDIRAMQQKMTEQAKAIMGTFKNSALFLESLLRQSHFDLGRYVLRAAKLDIGKFVVRPQFERYRSSFDEKHLHVDENQPSVPPEPCLVEADLGLISQVLANMLSNAAKYSVPAAPGQPGEIRCGVELVPGAFANGDQGVKVSVFSSGPHISPDEAVHLFDDNFRASNSSGQYGTGHGLFFVREIINEHKGLSGYTPAEGGNIFFFILPSVS